MAQKSLFKLVLVAIIMISFAACDKNKNNSSSNSNGSETSNLFVGTWTADRDNDVVVVLTATQWTAKYDGTIYNSGTYTYEGTTAKWTITNKGMSSASVGDTGIANMYQGKMVVSNFSDENMNGIYTKKN